jgi:hypothetical protein
LPGPSAMAVRAVGTVKPRVAPITDTVAPLGRAKL